MESNFDKCAGCGSKENFRFWCIPGKGTPYVLCRDCKSGGFTAVPDVWYGYGSGTHTEENIADPKTGEPIPFWDKRSKADAMRRAGVREAGDRIHGSRPDETKKRSYFV